MTITGAATGNGTFATANFAPQFQFHANAPLDFTRELVGQTQPNGRTFGQLLQSGANGDFNLFGNSGNAPVGYNYFTLEANGPNGNAANQMALVSLSAATATAAVPEAATWAMMMLGFGTMGFAMRRKSTRTRIHFA